MSADCLLNLKTPITSSLSEHDLLSQDKQLLEHSKKAEIFEKIGKLEFDTSILFKTGVKKKKSKKKPNKATSEGIVEIGQQADLSEKSTARQATEAANKVETNRPCLLDASFCDGDSIAPDLGSPKTMNKLLESKENKLAATYNIQPNDPAKGYEFKEVVQKPISPAYKEILEKTKNISLKHQDIVVDESPSDDK